MGVSGCGKSTIAALLAGRLGWDFVEGDDRLKNAVKSGTIPEQDIGPIIETLNRGLAQSGLTGPITADDAQAMVKSIGSLGLIEF